jgi:hypothetical protein
LSLPINIEDLKKDPLYYSFVQWNDFCIKENPPEEFMREYSNYIGWELLSWDNRLSEDFIRKFQDKLNWFFVSGLLELSEDFIREFSDKINYWALLRNPNIKLSNEMREFCRVFL